MTIEEIIAELKKGAVLTHFLPRTKYGFQELTLQMGQNQEIISRRQFKTLKKDKKITFVGVEGEFINIYTFNNLIK